jgi:hypothetical protein
VTLSLSALSMVVVSSGECNIKTKLAPQEPVGPLLLDWTTRSASSNQGVAWMAFI